MAFPVSQPDDGLIDVMAQPVVRLELSAGVRPLIPVWSSLHEKISYRLSEAQPKGRLIGNLAEKEREANIARNRALLEELELKQAVAGLGFTPSASKSTSKSKPQPVQSKKRVKKVVLDAEIPRRQSSRLKRAAVDPDESPLKRQKREAELELLRAQEAEARLEAEERARMANRPRRHDLELDVLLGEEEMEKISSFAAISQVIVGDSHPKRVADPEAFTYDKDNKREEVEVGELRERLQSLKIVSRAKVTQDRVYSAVYHPEISKDLIFFGDKHGQLGIWDARAPPDEVTDEDGEAETNENDEGGKYWRLQVHWPATSKSSISTVKLDPVNAHNACLQHQIWDVRKLTDIAVELPDVTGSEFGSEMVNNWLNTDSGKGCLRSEWRHDKSVSSAYWDPRGRSIVSTSYDDKLRRKS
ncbi:hypothetical protein C0993_009970 [Termitomyces sp. T159_Od127]|nr:hypothetical protein C0993_009970 [Termitomyces sp. T159_Od127]